MRENSMARKADSMFTIDVRLRAVVVMPAYTLPIIWASFLVQTHEKQLWQMN